mmetsp:Transcript_14113/g.29584  ORF Transcript_14113/g.29584 Transcript_14113/m.29584 type:complete len:90 (-) Transcript_14113:15-284(-)
MLSEASPDACWRAILNWWLGENLRELNGGGGVRTPVSNDVKPVPPQESTMATKAKERMWAARRWRKERGMAAMGLEQESRRQRQQSNYA